MQRLFALLTLILTLAGTQMASAETITGEMTLTFGWARRADGTMVSLQGVKVPWVATRIKAQKLNGIFDQFIHPTVGHNSGGNQIADATAYNNDNGDGNYYVNGLECPSALDDVKLSPAGNGQPWKYLTMGISSENGVKFLIRWQCFDSIVAGNGVGNSAFLPFPLPGNLDFGGLVNTIPSGTWKVTFDISRAGCYVNDGQCYFAIQFRTQQLNGEGAFIPSLSMVFNDGGATIGSSDDDFWYDSDENGIYDEFEVEQFQDKATASSFLLNITVNGTQTEIRPDTYTITKGQYISGSKTDLYFSNDKYLVFQGVKGVAQLVVEGAIPDPNVIGMSFKVESQALPGNPIQTIELFNYQTNQYDKFDTRTIGGKDTVVGVTVGSDPLKYVDANNLLVRARITWNTLQLVDRGALAPKPVIKVDQTVWTVVTP